MSPATDSNPAVAADNSPATAAVGAKPPEVPTKKNKRTTEPSAAPPDKKAKKSAPKPKNPEIVKKPPPSNPEIAPAPAPAPEPEVPTELVPAPAPAPAPEVPTEPVPALAPAPATEAEAKDVGPDPLDKFIGKFTPEQLKIVRDNFYDPRTNRPLRPRVVAQTAEIRFRIERLTINFKKKQDKTLEDVAKFNKSIAALEAKKKAVVDDVKNHKGHLSVENNLKLLLTHAYEVADSYNRKLGIDDEKATKQPLNHYGAYDNGEVLGRWGNHQKSMHDFVRVEDKSKNPTAAVAFYHAEAHASWKAQMFIEKLLAFHEMATKKQAAFVKKKEQEERKEKREEDRKKKVEEKRNKQAAKEEKQQKKPQSGDDDARAGVDADAPKNKFNPIVHQQIRSQRAVGEKVMDVVEKHTGSGKSAEAKLAGMCKDLRSLCTLLKDATDKPGVFIPKGTSAAKKKKPEKKPEKKAEKKDAQPPPPPPQQQQQQQQQHAPELLGEETLDPADDTGAGVVPLEPEPAPAPEPEPAPAPAPAPSNTPLADRARTRLRLHPAAYQLAPPILLLKGNVPFLIHTV